ncbi:MAG TPA: DUF5681 domain-containing protein [Stellaceae bacterium]|nr:DUF5681 domain-containing protein [Stellaceae bacterium]
MPDVGLIGTGETGERDGRGRFAKGCSGNPAGRPRGIPNPAARAALLLEGEAEALVRKAVDLALAGDAAALRLCLDRVLGPRRGRPTPFDLPAIDSALDLPAALAAIVAAAADGTLTAEEALALAQALAPLPVALEAREKEERLRERIARYLRSRAGGG